MSLKCTATAVVGRYLPLFHARSNAHAVGQLDVSQVKRRFREFESLHDQLKEFAGPELPPLPGKKLFSSMNT
jgi:hypothetical protein